MSKWMLIIAGLLGGYFLTCSTLPQYRYFSADELAQLPVAIEAASGISPEARCLFQEYYQPDTNRLEEYPLREIRVNIHFMNTTDSLYPYYGERAYQFAKDLIYYANEDLDENRQMTLPIGNNTPVLPPHYRLRLTGRPDDPDDRGVYWHFDDSLYYYVHRGRNANLMSRQVIKRYAVQPDTVLNMFVMPHHPDSIRSKTYPNERVGVALGTSVKLAGLNFDPDYPAWGYRGLINHEVGHVLGLIHSWSAADGCADTPVHPNDCFSPQQPGCGDRTPNNVMDYAYLQRVWTPCQIGRIRARFAQLGSRQRQLLKPRWCRYRDFRTLRIADTVSWLGARDLEGDLIIEPGGYLNVHCRLSLPPGARILVRAGGTLHLHDALVHSDCPDGEWRGIELEARGKDRGQILTSGRIRIEDAPGWPNTVNDD
jgi:hypothetical protein